MISVHSFNRYTKAILAALLSISILAGAQAGNSELEQLVASVEFAAVVDKTELINKLTPHLSAIENESSAVQFKYYATLARAYSHIDNLSQAHRYHAVADKVAPPAVFSSRIYTDHLIDWAGNYYERQQHQAGQNVITRLYRLAEQYSDKVILLGTLNIDMLFALARDDWSTAQNMADQAIALTESPDMRYKNNREKTDYEALTLQRTARLYREFQPSRAIALYEIALPLERKIKSLTGEEACLHYLAIFHLEAGNTLEARRYIDEMLAFAKMYRRQLGYLSAYTTSSRLHYMNGDLSAANRDILRAEVHLKNDSLPSLKQRYALQKAVLLMQQNQAREVVELLAPKQDLFQTSNFMQLRLQYFELLSNAYAMIEQPEQANAMQQQALTLALLWQEKAAAVQKERQNIR